MLVTGCANKDFPVLEEFRQVTAEARKPLNASLRSLEKVSAATAPYSPRLVAAFGNDVQRLEVESIKVRSRVQAILARGDAYFADWSENIAQVKSAKIRERAERFHPQLEQSFGRIKTASQRAGLSFQPYLTALREMRQKLEAKPEELGTDAAKQSFGKTHDNGQKVVRELDNINSELRAIHTMLTTGRAEPKP